MNWGRIEHTQVHVARRPVGTVPREVSPTRSSVVCCMCRVVAATQTKWRNCCVELRTRTNHTRPHVRSESLAMTYEDRLSCTEVAILLELRFVQLWVWKVPIFWVVTSWNPFLPWCFGGIYCLRFQGWRICKLCSQRVGWKKILLFNHNMEAVFSFDTSVELY
jgi:hypothetical protein